jgi:hypothetical protein
MLGWVVALLVCGACRGRSQTGELSAPPGAPEFESRFGVAFDDAYTREPIELSGRAPNDVLDQRLFAARLGHAHVVALVTVLQVWARGRYQGRQDQRLDVEIGEILMGALPKGTHEEQLIEVAGEDALPGTLQGKPMILFVRWAPGEVPGYHHHLMPADDELVAYIQAMVKHAQTEGVLNDRGVERKWKRRSPRKSRKNRSRD